MQKLIRPSIAILLSCAIILFGGVSPSVNQKQPIIIKTTYNDLRADVKKQVDCLADNIYFEARAEPFHGQLAVAFVTLNRVQSGMFPETVCGVVKQRSSSTCQFSWWCNPTLKKQSMRRSFDQDTYTQIRRLATHVFLNYDTLTDVTQGAIFFHAHYVPRRLLGVKNIEQTVQIGQHIFYRNSI